jgi:hypothetical protein
MPKMCASVFGEKIIAETLTWWNCALCDMWNAFDGDKTLIIENIELEIYHPCTVIFFDACRASELLFPRSSTDF